MFELGNAPGRARGCMEAAEQRLCAAGGADPAHHRCEQRQTQKPNASATECESAGLAREPSIDREWEDRPSNCCPCTSQLKDSVMTRTDNPFAHMHRRAGSRASPSGASHRAAHSQSCTRPPLKPARLPRPNGAQACVEERAGGVAGKRGGAWLHSADTGSDGPFSVCSRQNPPSWRCRLNRRLHARGRPHAPSRRGSSARRVSHDAMASECSKTPDPWTAGGASTATTRAMHR